VTPPRSPRFPSKIAGNGNVAGDAANPVLARRAENSPFMHQVFFQSTWGRCYDHNFLRFLPISAKKMAFFSKIDVMIIFCKN
jgi:hypothetical protein